MFRLTTFGAALFLLFSVDVPWSFPLRQQTLFPQSVNLPDLASPPDLFLAVAEGPSPRGNSTGQLVEQSKLMLIRYVDGEFVKVVQPLPSDKHGFRYKPDKPVDTRELHTVLRHGSAANPGDKVQITNLEFKGSKIYVSINGGPKGHFDWRRHIQVSMGGPYATAQPISDPVGAAPGGSLLILDYSPQMPDLTPDELKHDLSPFLSFGGEHSSAVDWVQTLPPQYQKAIKQRMAVEGMNRDMVMAAMGRPDQKFRERNLDDKETEDWIYGQPPGRVTIVTFSADKVIRVKQFN